MEVVVFEFKGEFKKINQRLDQIDNKFDQKFDRLYSVLMWGFGLMLTSVFGLYIKMFLG